MEAAAEWPIGHTPPELVEKSQAWLKLHEYIEMPTPFTSPGYRAHESDDALTDSLGVSGKFAGMTNRPPTPAALDRPPPQDQARRPPTPSHSTDGTVPKVARSREPHITKPRSGKAQSTAPHGREAPSRKRRRVSADEEEEEEDVEDRRPLKARIRTLLPRAQRRNDDAVLLAWVRWKSRISRRRSGSLSSVPAVLPTRDDRLV